MVLKLENPSPFKKNYNTLAGFSNKLLTWEVLLRRGFNGLRYYALCIANSVTTSHNFIHFPYAGTVWDQVTKTLDPTTSTT